MLLVLAASIIAFLPMVLPPILPPAWAWESCRFHAACAGSVHHCLSPNGLATNPSPCLGLGILQVPCCLCWQRPSLPFSQWSCHQSFPLLGLGNLAGSMLLVLAASIIAFLPMVLPPILPPAWA